MKIGKKKGRKETNNRNDRFKANRDGMFESGHNISNIRVQSGN